MNNSQNTAFFSTVLGPVEHPINIIREYRAVLPKSAARIVTALDGWVRTHQQNKEKYPKPEWVYAPALGLSKQIDLCRDTVQRWLSWLVEMGYLLRERAFRWPTDRAYKYCITDKLKEALQDSSDDRPNSLSTDFQAMDNWDIPSPSSASLQSNAEKSATSYVPHNSTDFFFQGPEEEVEMQRNLSACSKAPNPTSGNASNSAGTNVPSVANEQLAKLSKTSKQKYQELPEKDKAKYDRVTSDPGWLAWFVERVVEADPPKLQECPRNVEAAGLSPNMVLRWGDEFLAGQEERETARERSELFAKACNRRVDWQEAGHQVAVVERDGCVMVMVNGREFPCEEFLAMEVGAVEPILARAPSEKAKSIIERLKSERVRKRSPWLSTS